MKALDLTGQQFNGFTVIKRVPNIYNDGKSSWLCRCNCGKEWITTSNYIRNAKGCSECVHKGRQKKKFYIPNSGKRMWDLMLKKKLEIRNMSKCTGISQGAIRDFLYNGADISSARLAKLCDYCHVSADYILGLKEA